MPSRFGILARLFFFLIKPTVIATGFVIFLYGIIIWSLNRGVSIDEGYYLLGYLKEQPIRYALTDFHYIVKSLFFFLPEDNALFLRIIRFILTLLALGLLTHSSYNWISNQYGIQINRFTYFILSFLVGVLCFAYASPVLYYDNIQMIIYFLSCSLLFLIINDPRKTLLFIYSFLLGFLLIYGLTNYIPAGISLGLISLITIYISIKPGYRTVLRIISAYFLGFIISTFIYSLFIHNIFDVIRGIYDVYASATQFESTKYEAGGQFVIILKYLIDLAITIALSSAIILAYFFSRKYLYKYRIGVDIIYYILSAYLIYKLSSYYSNVVLFPILAVFLIGILEGRTSLRQQLKQKRLWFLIILIIIPFLAVLGSNQLLARKMFFYMPFWFFAFYLVMAEFKILRTSKGYNRFLYILIATVFIVFIFQGFLKHPHYNYSIKRSKHIIENAVRFKNIKVSEYQKYFYENGIQALNANGFKPGGNILAFYETYMLVYAAGGYVPDGLTYWAYQFASDPDNIPDEKVDFIIIDESEIELMTEFLSQTDWDFPVSYKRTDLGTDGHNLTQLGFNYLLFSKYP